MQNTVKPSCKLKQHIIFLLLSEATTGSLDFVGQLLLTLAKNDKMVVINIIANALYSVCSWNNCI